MTSRVMRANGRLLLAVAISSQNLLPIHIAFIPLLVPPLLYVLSKLQLDRRLIACVLTFGLITPPYGLVLLMASKFVGVRFSQALRAALPIYAVFLITIVFIIFFPEVVLWIPKQVLPQSVGCFHNPSGAGFICPNG